jgi:hypothetical protein
VLQHRRTVEGGGVDAELEVGSCRDVAATITGDQRRSEAALDQRWTVLRRPTGGWWAGPEQRPAPEEDEEVMGNSDGYLNRSQSEGVDTGRVAHRSQLRLIPSATTTRRVSSVVEKSISA